MPAELNTDVLNHIRHAIELGQEQHIRQMLAEWYPADIAEVIRQLNDTEALIVFKAISSETASEVLLELDEERREILLSSLSTKQIAQQLDNMDSDDAADVISELPENIQTEVLSQIEDITQASDIAELITYQEGTAGSLMAKELVRVYTSDHVSQCIHQIREQDENVDVMYAVYVVDEVGRLRGMLSLKRLIIAHPMARVEELFEPDIISVNVLATSEEVAGIMQKYDLVVLPVIDTLGRLVGRITIDDVVDVIRESADEQVQRLSGLSDDVDPNDRFWRNSRARIPWLLVGMCGGIIGSRIIGAYETQIRIHPEMAYFIPLIGAMGGNVGVQSSAIIVQGLANRSIISNTIIPRLLKELGVGVLNGLICAVLIWSYAFIIQDWQLAATVSMSLFTVILCASVLGTFVPLTLNRFKINPALATGPFVTTLNDIIGITIYFLVGRLLYGLF